MNADERAQALAHEPMRLATPQVGLLRGARASLLDVWHRRDLLYLLTRREIRARYKDSVLGILWSLIKPLMNLLIYVLVLGKMMGAERSIPDFAIYVFTGLTAWQLFSDIISTGTASIVANSGIIKKIQLPREIFPLASVGASSFNFLMQGVILLLAIILLPIAGTAHPVSIGLNLLYLPLSLLVLLLWATSCALVLAAVNVYLRDIQYLVEVVLMIGMWASPIVYSWSMVTSLAAGKTWLEQVYLTNPVTLVVMGFQQALWGAATTLEPAPMLPLRLTVAGVLGILVLAIAQRIFASLQRNFAQEL